MLATIIEHLPTLLPSFVMFAICGMLGYVLRTRLQSLLTPRGFPGIPAYPHATPILGDIPRIATSLKKKKDSSSFFAQIGRDLGPIAQVRLTAFKTLVVVNDYAEIVSVLNRHQQFDRAAHTASFFQNVMSTAQFVLPAGEMWKRHRRLTVTSASPKSLAAMTPGLVSNIKQLVELFDVKRQLAEGRPWEMGEDFYSAALDFIASVTFGESMDILRSTSEQVKAGGVKVGKLGEAVFDCKRGDLGQTAIYLMIESIPVKSSFPNIARRIQKLSPTWHRQKRAMHRYLRERLEVSRERTKARGDGAIDLADCALDVMVARAWQGVVPITEDELIDEAMLYVVGGTETVAVAMQWYPKFMTNHPEVQHRLRAHLLERIPELQDREMRYDDVVGDKLPYLEAVVHECLRLARVAPALAREATVDTTIMGYAIPKGTMIVLPASYTHANEEPFQGKSDARRDSDVAASMGEKGSIGGSAGGWRAGTGATFDPDRWLVDSKFDIHAGPSLPFSTGLRSCFGKKLALLELRLVIAHLTLAFFFAPLEDRFNSQETYEVLATHAKQTFVKMDKWN